ncbi:hypothetical protein [Nostoc sp. DedQUE04]|uniref:hypothetical protein n=1 Tax=Nostoc sp. DedQUE04 TaxID=3075390 RepID=UPI002AD25B81|nr:hypothetical protein [Nostoc sp. DedQUE04]
MKAVSPNRHAHPIYRIYLDNLDAIGGNDLDKVDERLRLDKQYFYKNEYGKFIDLQ